MGTTFPTTQDMPEPTRLTLDTRYDMELTQHYRMLQVGRQIDRFETTFVAFGHQNLLCPCKLRSFIYYIAHMIWDYNSTIRTLLDRLFDY